MAEKARVPRRATALPPVPATSAAEQHEASLRQKFRSRRAPTFGPGNPSLLPRPDPLHPDDHPAHPFGLERSSPSKPEGQGSVTEVHEPVRKLELHAGVVSALRTHNQTMLVSCGGEGHLARWDIANPTGRPAAPVAHIRGQPRALAVGFEAADGLVLYVGCNDGKILKYELESMSPLPFGSPTSRSAVTGLCAAGELLAVSLQNGRAITLRLPSGELASVFEGAHKQPVQSPAVASDRLMLASNDGSCSSWNLHTGQLLHKFDGHTDQVKALCLEWGLLLSASMDRTARAWRVSTGELVTEFVGALSLWRRE